eukprot:8157491-Ditylum_brightwellii.AAC.1
MEYCLTGMVLGNFYTRPLQGKAFRTFCNMVLNVESLLQKEVSPKLKLRKRLSTETQKISSRVSLQERVGQSKIQTCKNETSLCTNTGSDISDVVVIARATKTKKNGQQI